MCFVGKSPVQKREGQSPAGEGPKTTLWPCCAVAQSWTEVVVCPSHPALAGFPQPGLPRPTWALLSGQRPPGAEEM